MVPRLEIKRSENRERREGEALIQSMPPALGALLGAARVIYTHEGLELMPLLPGRDLATLSIAPRFGGCDYRDFDRPEQVAHALAHSPLELKAPVLGWFGTGPVFCFDRPIELRILAEIPHLNDLRIYLAEKEGTAGFVLDQYVGYLPEDRRTSDGEIVYECVWFS